ncbi:MAG TPA: Cof-type HAD-IIB family hydrolase [Chthoniobacterales bacterium]|nr:Cof-type HAD-IIB family hydrolase [Chthoniobacterales bacterium]
MSHSRMRLVAVDVDGTLLDSSHQLRPGVRFSIEKLATLGVKIVLATARGPQALGLIVRQLNFSPLLICFSGGWTGELDPQSLLPANILFDKRLTPSAARVVVTAALAHKLEPNVYTPTEWRVRTLTAEIRAESEIVESSPLVTPTLLGENEKPSKIMLVAGNDEQTKRLTMIANLIKPLSNATFSKPEYLEIIPIGVNKAKALAQVAQTLGLELSHIAAIGDGLNDVEMLKDAGLGIAMGNAAEPVKSVAKWVTGTNDEEGVAQAAARLLSERLV